MSKNIKMLLYGEAGIGKSTFVSKFPKPFFLCSDGNYEWLNDVDPNAHLDITSWSKMKTVIDTNKFDGYDTIVVDLIEDFFKWCEAEYVKKKGIDHISDEGFGKGYDTTRTEFFVYMTKLIAKPKNIVFISHESVTTWKDKRGVEHTSFAPSSMLPGKVLEMVAGRLRYVLHCYLTDERLPDGSITQHRMLSLTKKPDEFNVFRGYNVDAMPQEIPLDADTFFKAIGYEDEVEAPLPAVSKDAVKAAAEQIKIEQKPAAVIEPVIEPKPIIKNDAKTEAAKPELDAIRAAYSAKQEEKQEVKAEEPSISAQAEEPRKKTNEEIRLEILKKLGKI